MNKRKDQWLVFVDTNILLDFYRLRGGSALRQIALLEKHKSSLILSEQVRMEYLKHRQRVVAETLTELKKPTDQKLPAILEDYQPAGMMKKHIKSSVSKYTEVKEKAERILSDPGRHDKVYQSLSRIFNHKSRYNLDLGNKSKVEIRNLARKRFVLGYPPRKSSDNSIGDAVNWEWIIKCAQVCPDNRNILIVSRDTDYGYQSGNSSIINDWLKREFQDRVSRKRKIELTTKLTDAMKRLDETVPQEDEDAEEKVIRTWPQYRNHLIGSSDGSTSPKSVQKLNFSQFMDKLLQLESQQAAEREELDELLAEIESSGSSRGGQDHKSSEADD